MATKKKTPVPIPAPLSTLLLHCKCNQCATWGLRFDPATQRYCLVCTSCHEEIEVYVDLGKPHVSLHWEKE
jgi:hypothetical protein